MTIRLSRGLIDDLNADARQKGITVTDVIRSTLEERQLRGAKLDETREVVLQLRAELKRFRRELALSTEVLLSYGGKTPSDEAREWVSNTFGRED